MAFAILLPEKPRSLQGDPAKRQRYKDRIATLAREIFGAAPPLEGELYARIIWFYSGKAQGDIDNMVKPILDALKEIVYRDDGAVVKCVSEKIDKNNAIISSSNITPSLYATLLSMMARDDIPHFIYIEIGSLPNRQIVFGSVL